MKKKIIVDTGPLVAFINHNDKYHSWSKNQLSHIVPPLLTCEAVLTETCFLLKKVNGGHNTLFELIDRKLIEIKFQLKEEMKHVHKILERYSDLPTSFADACLVRMAELNENAQILTLDNDFQVYRKHNRQVIPLIIPS